MRGATWMLVKFDDLTLFYSSREAFDACHVADARGRQNGRISYVWNR